MIGWAMSHLAHPAKLALIYTYLCKQTTLNSVFVASHQLAIMLILFIQDRDSDNSFNKYDVVKRQSDQNCQCKDGIPGPRGPPGNKGKIGKEGKQGLKGDTGPPGSRGDAGDRGPRGKIGI